MGLIYKLCGPWSVVRGPWTELREEFVIVNYLFIYKIQRLWPLTTTN